MDADAAPARAGACVSGSRRRQIARLMGSAAAASYANERTSADREASSLYAAPASARSLRISALSSMAP